MPKTVKKKSRFEVEVLPHIERFETKPTRVNYKGLLKLRPGDGAFVPDRGYHHVYSALHRAKANTLFRIWEGEKDGVSGTFVRRLEA